MQRSSNRRLDLLAAAERAITNAPVEYVAQVAGVREDGKLNLTLRGGVLLGVPALASYSDRLNGDVVVVRKTRAGWYVVGKTGQDPVVVAADTPPVTPPATAPDTVQPTGGDAYRSGNRRNDTGAPVQGDWGGWGSNTGVWVYGTALHTAVTAGTVTKAELTLTRSSGRHGSYGNVGVHVYTHTATSLPQPTPGRLAGPWHVGSLSLGERDTFVLPDDCVASLADTGRGLLVYNGHSDYIIFTAAGANNGAVKVTYA